MPKLMVFWPSFIGGTACAYFVAGEPLAGTISAVGATAMLGWLYLATRKGVNR